MQTNYCRINICEIRFCGFALKSQILVLQKYVKVGKPQKLILRKYWFSKSQKLILLKNLPNYFFIILGPKCQASANFNSIFLRNLLQPQHLVYTKNRSSKTFIHVNTSTEAIPLHM